MGRVKIYNTYLLKYCCRHFKESDNENGVVVDEIYDNKNNDPNKTKAKNKQIKMKHKAKTQFLDICNNTMKWTVSHPGFKLD